MALLDIFYCCPYCLLYITFPNDYFDLFATKEDQKKKTYTYTWITWKTFFFVALEFGSKTRKFGRDQKIYMEPYFQVIYIYTYFQGGAPASEYFILRCFQQLPGATHPPILLVLMFWGYWVPWGHWLHCFLERLIWEPWRLLRDALVLHILQGWKKNTWHLKRCGLIILKEQVFHIFWVHRMVTTTDPKDRPFLTTCTILLITWFPWRFYFLWVQLVLVVLL